MSVFVGSELFGRGDPTDKLVRAFTKDNGSLYMVEWVKPDSDEPAQHRCIATICTSRGGLKRLINKLQRLADAAKFWHVSFGGTLSLLMSVGDSRCKVGHVTVDGYGRVVLSDTVKTYLEDVNHD